MSTGLKILGVGALIIGAGYAWTYRKAYKVLSQCKYAISRVFVDSIDSTGFVLGIRVKITNPSNTELSVEGGNKLLFYINASPVARVVVPYQQFIKPQDATEILLAVVSKWNDYNNWWNILLGLSNTADLKVAGKLKVDGLSIPIPPISVYQYNIDDVVKVIKQHV